MTENVKVFVYVVAAVIFCIALANMLEPSKNVQPKNNVTVVAP